MGFNKASFPQANPLQGVKGLHAGSCAIAASRLILTPAAVENVLTFTKFYYTISAMPIASNIALHVFDSLFATQLYASGSIASAVGSFQQAISLTLPRGTYWLGIQCDRTDTRFQGPGALRQEGFKGLKKDGVAFPHVGALTGVVDLAPYTSSAVGDTGVPAIGLGIY